MGTFSFFWLPKVFYFGKKGKYGRFFRFVNTWWGNFQNKKAPEYSLFLESRAGIFPIYNQKIGSIVAPIMVPNYGQLWKIRRKADETGGFGK